MPGRTPRKGKSEADLRTLPALPVVSVRPLFSSGAGRQQALPLDAPGDPCPYCLSAQGNSCHVDGDPERALLRPERPRVPSTHFAGLRAPHRTPGSPPSHSCQGRGRGLQQETADFVRAEATDGLAGGCVYQKEGKRPSFPRPAAVAVAAAVAVGGDGTRAVRGAGSGRGGGRGRAKQRRAGQGRAGGGKGSMSRFFRGAAGRSAVPSSVHGALDSGAPAGPFDPQGCRSEQRKCSQRGPRGGGGVGRSGVKGREGRARSDETRRRRTLGFR